MKKMITLAVLGVLAAGQVHAANGTRGETTSSQAAKSSATASNAKKSAERLSLEAKIKDARAQVEKSPMASRLSPSQRVNLMKNMVRDAQVAQIAQTILKDSDSSRAELNEVTLEGLANLKLGEKSSNEAALSAMGVKSADVTVAKDAYKTLIVDVLGTQARAWKDAAQVKNAIVMAKEANSQMTSGKTELQAMQSAQAKLKAETGIQIELKKILELCKKA